MDGAHGVAIVAAILQVRNAVQDGVDKANKVKMGTRRDVIEEAREIIEKAAQNPN